LGGLAGEKGNMKKKGGPVRLWTDVGKAERRKGAERTFLKESFTPLLRKGIVLDSSWEERGRVLKTKKKGGYTNNSHT